MPSLALNTLPRLRDTDAFSIARDDDCTEHEYSQPCYSSEISQPFFKSEATMRRCVSDLLDELLTEFNQLQSQLSLAKTENLRLRSKLGVDQAPDEIADPEQEPTGDSIQSWGRLVANLCNRKAGSAYHYEVRTTWEETPLFVTSHLSNPGAEGFDEHKKVMRQSLHAVKGGATHHQGSLVDMISEAHRQPLHSHQEHHDCILHPTSLQRIVWSMISLFLICYDALTLSLEPFTKMESTIFRVMWWMSTAFWPLDIVVSFRTAVYVKGDLERRPYYIARQYLYSWFILDLVCSLPPWVELILESQASNGTNFTITFRVLKILRYYRFVRLAKLRHILGLLPTIINSPYVLLLLRFLWHLVIVVIWVHSSGSIWFALGSAEGGWVESRDDVGTRPLYMYLLSIHWAAAQMQGSSDLYGKTTPERAYAVTAILFSIMCMAAFVSGLTNIMIELRELSKQFDQSQIVRTYFQKHSVSSDLQMRVRNYIEASQLASSMQKQAQEEANALQLLPTSLKRQVIEQMRAQVVCANPVLRAMQACNQRCFERLCNDAFAQLWVIPGEQIFSYCELCHCMYVVAQGSLTYLKYTMLLQSLTSKLVRARNSVHNRPSVMATGGSVPLNEKYCSVGKSLCEAILWTRWVHCGDFAAHSYSSVLKLQASDFEGVISVYADIYAMMRDHAHHFVKVLNERDEYTRSDLYDSITMLEDDEQMNPEEHQARPKFMRGFSSFRSNSRIA